MEGFSGFQMWAGRMRGGLPLVVLAGSGGQHAGGLGPLPRVGGGGAVLGSAWIFASAAITFHSKQLAHNGYSGARSPSDRTWRSQVVPARVPQYNKEASIHLTGGHMSRCDDARPYPNWNKVPAVEQGATTNKQSHLKAFPL